MTTTMPTTTSTYKNEMTTMPKSTTTPTLDAALAALEQAQQAAAEAEESARTAQAASDDRRRQALADYDQEVLDAYDPEDLDAQIAAAQARLIVAVESDPVYAALADLAEATGIAYGRYSDADRAARHLGVDTLPAQRAPAGDLNVEAMLRHMAGVAAGRVRTAADALAEERQAVGDAAAKGA